MSHNWANRITKYRDTITEDSSTVNKGALNILITDNEMVNELTQYRTVTTRLKWSHMAFLIDKVGRHGVRMVATPGSELNNHVFTPAE